MLQLMGVGGKDKQAISNRRDPDVAIMVGQHAVRLYTALVEELAVEHIEGIHLFALAVNVVDIDLMVGHIIIADIITVNGGMGYLDRIDRHLPGAGMIGIGCSLGQNP